MEWFKGKGDLLIRRTNDTANGFEIGEASPRDRKSSSVTCIKASSTHAFPLLPIAGFDQLESRIGLTVAMVSMH